ncbi:hypothetical protein VTN02DRAFT_3188 [Thermoascus thermophilus]
MSPSLQQDQDQDQDHPQITPNVFLSLTQSSSSPSSSASDPDPYPDPDRDAHPTTIFFISGNPGLISYYHAFLALLSAELGRSSSSSSRTIPAPPSFRIYGASLGGFEVSGTGDGDDGGSVAAGPAQQEEKVYGLQEQIALVEARLRGVMRAYSNRNRSRVRRGPKPRVILIGHSVGAYIAMEILRRHREGRVQGDADADADADAAAFDIVGGILLFPTVVDIAKSVAGRRVAWLLYLVPQLALVASLLAKALTWALPTAILRSVIRLVMGFPPEDAVDTTLAFLRSKRGVRQALHMAADEMREITADQWSDEIWGTSSSAAKQQPPSQLVFYFGRNDHWVAERTRDEIIAMRGKSKKGGPRMVVCEDGVPHAFCIRHSDVMARKVARFIRDIVEGV